MIGIVDYNMGNLASVKNAFYKIGVKAEVVNDADKLRKYDKLLFPGVGAFKDAMEHLKSNNLDDAMKDFIKSGKYVLGICLGMQLLFESSEEFGFSEGLGIIKGEVVKFNIDKKVPHMGWNKMFFTKKTELFENLNNPYLYFVHSYHVKTDDKYVIGETFYGYKFTSAVRKDNVFGFQPHPEKSHNEGLKILANFANL